MLSFMKFNSIKLSKHLKLKAIIFALFIGFLLTLIPNSALAQQGLSDTQLDSNAIDMLVGTPTKVQDPLNPQKIQEQDKQEKIDLSKYLEDWELENNSEKIGWDDAETGEKNVNIDVESQYLDLIAEMNIDDTTEFSEKSITNFEMNSANSVETEN
eukprot:Anaeramoba_ignava/a347284_143.p2 GENE.a347284_143~~a347284_143.p2  ORF type:complete len:156 (-),score=37.93 a347284_143:771-1238(-)